MEHLYSPPIIQNNERSASGSYFILVLAGMQDMGKLPYSSAVKPFYAESLTSYCDIVCTVSSTSSSLFCSSSVGCCIFSLMIVIMNYKKKRRRHKAHRHKC